MQEGAKFWKIKGMVEPKHIVVSWLGALNHLTLYLTSILDVYKVFKHLHMMWMGVWVQPYIIKHMQVGAKF